jgi:dTDP-4-amino-4,6-dideoxygalactose transaminase
VAERIPLSYNPIDIEALTGVLRRYEGLHHNQIVADFEEAIRDYTGSPYVLALNSGTSAIHLGLKALGVGLNDYVFVSTFTFIGSVNPILYLGAQPVFIDSEAETWNMDPQLLEQALTDFANSKKLPKAIVVVHTYGMPAKIDQILMLAKKFGVPVLEDAAEAIGSRFKGNHVGTLGEVGVLSFNNNKTVTTFGGGALLTADEEIYQKSKRWAAQAAIEGVHYGYEEIGYNYRMGPLNAAAGLAGLKDVEVKLKLKREIFEFYTNQFAKTEGITWQVELPETRSNYWLSCFLIERNVNLIAKKLEEFNIETRPLWKPMHILPIYHGCETINRGVAEKMNNSGICLPSSIFLSKDHLKEIKELICI